MPLNLGVHDDLLSADYHSGEVRRSRETVKRASSSCLGNAIADATDHGYCASHSRWFWGIYLHTLMAPDGTPTAITLTSPKEGEREVCLRQLRRANRTGPLTVLGDKGYAGAEFEADAAELAATVVRSKRKDEPEGSLHLAPLRRRIESIYRSAKDILGLERHGARTLRRLRVRIGDRFPGLAAAVSLNYELGRPSRATTCPDSWNYSSRPRFRMKETIWARQTNPTIPKTPKATFRSPLACHTGYGSLIQQLLPKSHCRSLLRGFDGEPKRDLPPPRRRPLRRHPPGRDLPRHRPPR